MTNFPWHEQLNLSMDTNWQLKTFTEIFLNIMSNYIPNETKRFVLRVPPWITKPIKTMLNRKNRLFKNKKNIIITMMLSLGLMHFVLNVGFSGHVTISHSRVQRKKVVTFFLGARRIPTLLKLNSAADGTFVLQ